MEIYKPGMDGYNQEVDDTESSEKYMRIPKDSLKNIPVYARKDYLITIKKVMSLESEKYFKRGLYYVVLTDLSKNTFFQNKYGNDLIVLKV